MTQCSLFTPLLGQELPDGAATMSTPKLIAQLKEAGQDHEFYPTTNAIIQALVSDIKYSGRHLTSVLDIGAGNGKVLTRLRKETQLTELHAIEKSSILCNQLDPEILVIGTNFHEQSLLSKVVDVIFCNPPYSEFVAWTEKIIRQAAAQYIYLVIPARWESSTEIKDAIKFRDGKVHKLGQFDFESAEDRQARAIVHLLRIDLPREELNDPFRLFFKEQYAPLFEKFKEPRHDSDSQEPEKDQNKRPYHGLVIGPNYPDALVNLYRQELATIERNYQLISELDVPLLKEFQIDPFKIMVALRNRLSGLKHEYWQELFSHLNTVTDRLTSKSRQKLLGTLQKHVEVDFTSANIYEIVVWVIKNANHYMETQLIETYEEMVAKCNVHLYKSNKRVWTDQQWRYCRDDEEKPSHYALDYRIVTHRVGGIGNGNYYSERGLRENAANFIGDLLTIARNLNFPCQTVHQCLSYDGRHDWVSGEKRVFNFTSNDNQVEELFDVRAFMNGNLHLRLNKQFILALNVEHGRLKGWLRTPQEAVTELQDSQAAEYFTANHQIPLSNPTLLLSAAA